MSDFHPNGNYLSAEMNLRFNPNKNAIEITTHDPDLSKNGFIVSVPADSRPGKTVLDLLAERSPELASRLRAQELPLKVEYLPESRHKYFGSDEFPLGRGLDNFLFWNPVEDGNLLVVSPQNAGRHTLVKNLIAHATRFDGWNTAIICPRHYSRKVFTSRAEEHPHNVIVPPVENMLILLNGLRDKMDHTYTLLGRRKVERYTDLPLAEQPVSSLLILNDYYDEEDDERGDYSTEARIIIDDLIKFGRAAGIHVVATRWSERATVPATGFDTVIATAKLGGADVRAHFGTPEAEKLFSELPVFAGRGVLYRRPVTPDKQPFLSQIQLALFGNDTQG